MPPLESCRETFLEIVASLIGALRSMKSSLVPVSLRGLVVATVQPMARCRQRPRVSL
jgi:hypothetical protein